MTAEPAPHSRYRQAGPPTGTMLWRGLTKPCPVCGQRGLFDWERMVEDCPCCGFHFERIEGHWIGAIGVNTIVSFGLLIMTIFVSVLATCPDFPVTRLVVLCLAVSIFVPLLFHPSSRTLWTAIDLAMRPLQPHEADPAIILSQTPTNQKADPAP
ncbi:MAG: hypothetical protein O3C27_16530 [Actinomycetota bacterium]|nr:hypothetical protein [Actinomycetota bacterium]